jgi:hypothetical protein
MLIEKKISEEPEIFLLYPLFKVAINVGVAPRSDRKVLNITILFLIKANWLVLYFDNYQQGPILQRSAST